MEIPVNKNSLASALTALGKLVSRTSLIKAYQGIEIEGKAPGSQDMALNGV